MLSNYVYNIVRPCRTIDNMMICNIAAATIIYCIQQIIAAGFAL